MPTHGSTHGPITPHCPRCGYDQSGEVSTWTDRCPTRGTCPECGTRFDWADLFNPSRQDILWLIDHARSLSDARRRTPQTLHRMAWPPAFWRGVPVTARVRPWVLAAWCLVLLLMLHALTTGAYYHAHASWTRMWFGASATGGGGVLSSGVSTGELRGLALRVALLDSWIETAQSVTGRRKFRTAFFTTGGVLALRPLLWAAAAAGVTGIWICILTVVPVTRRAAALRSAHIARAAILGLFAACLIVELHRATNAASILWRTPAPQRIAYWINSVGSPLLFLWTVLWWRAAAKSGWSLNRAGPLVALATLAALLGAAVAVLMIDRNAIAWLLVRWT